MSAVAAGEGAAATPPGRASRDCCMKKSLWICGSSAGIGNTGALKASGPADGNGGNSGIGTRAPSESHSHPGSVAPAPDVGGAIGGFPRSARHEFNAESNLEPR